MKPFYILLNDFNTKEPMKHNIMPHLLYTYNTCKEKNNWYPLWNKELKKVPEAPKTFLEFKTFVSNICRHQYWARAQYEWIMCPWPYHDLDSEENIARFKKEMHKIDAWKQIEMNLDVVVDLFLENINEKKF